MAFYSSTPLCVTIASCAPSARFQLVSSARITARNAAVRSRASTSSTFSTFSSRKAAASTRPTHPAAEGHVSMPWDDYFKLRKSRRTWGTVAAVPTTIAGVMVGGGYFAHLQSEPGQQILGFEPIVIYGAAILGCVAAGWLTGPILGNGLWRLTHRNVLKKVEEMDNLFLRHVQSRRVDPSRQSVNNPVPDYYGEHIYSKKQYRQWLRDQAAYRRKATFGGREEEAL